MTDARKVLIADDHALARAGFARLIREAALDFEIVEAADGGAVLDAIRAHRFQLIILDVALPGRSGLDILRHLRSSHPHIPVLMLSGYPEKQYAVNVLRAGAMGYLEKNCAADELVKAVETVLGGTRYVTPRAAELVLGASFAGEDRPLHAQLSEREFDVFLKLANGQGNAEVAAELYLSAKTISTYRARILAKLDMRTNADLTRYALETGLLQ